MTKVGKLLLLLLFCESLKIYEKTLSQNHLHNFKICRIVLQTCSRLFFTHSLINRGEAGDQKGVV